MRLFEKIIWSQSGKNIIKLLSGTAAAQIVSILCLPIISRIYGPEYYGEFALITSMISVLVGFMGFGLNSAILLSRNDEEAAGLYKISKYLCFALTTCMFLLTLLISPFYRFFQGSIEYYYVCFIISWNVIVTNNINMQYSWLNRSGNYNALVWNPIIIAVINNVTCLLLGLFDYKSVGLIGGLSLSQLIALILLQKSLKQPKIDLDFQTFMTLLKNNYKFIVYQYPSNIIDGFIKQIPIFFMSFFFGPSVTGYFSMAQRLLSVPISLIGTSVGRVYIKNMSDMVPNFEKINNYTLFTIKKALSAYMVVVVAILALGDIFIPLILGMKWVPIGDFIRIMAIWNIFALVIACTSGFPSVVGRQKLDFIVSLISLFLEPTVFLICGGIIFNPKLVLLIYVLLHAAIHVVFYNILIDNSIFGRYLIYIVKYALIIGVVYSLIRIILLYGMIASKF